MPIIDIVLIALLVIALITGLSRGFLATIGFFAGLALGAVAAYWATPFVGQWVTSPSWRGPAMMRMGSVAPRSSRRRASSALRAFSFAIMSSHPGYRQRLAPR